MEQPVFMPISYTNTIKFKSLQLQCRWLHYILCSDDRLNSAGIIRLFGVMFNDIIGLTGLQTIMKCETGRVIVAQCGV